MRAGEFCGQIRHLLQPHGEKQRTIGRRGMFRENADKGHQGATEKIVWVLLGKERVPEEKEEQEIAERFHKLCF